MLRNPYCSRFLMQILTQVFISMGKPPRNSANNDFRDPNRSGLFALTNPFYSELLMQTFLRAWSLHQKSLSPCPYRFLVPEQNPKRDSRKGTEVLTSRGKFPNTAHVGVGETRGTRTFCVEKPLIFQDFWCRPAYGLGAVQQQWWIDSRNIRNPHNSLSLML